MCRWEVIIRMDLREVWWEDMDWMHLAQWWAVVKIIMNL
jgi:hypothetical protein